MRIMLTGGAGYIGTHIAVDLITAGHQGIIVDDLSNSHPSALARVEQISGTPVSFHRLDLRDEVRLREVFAKETPEAVIHLAGLKAVGESVREPARYYDTNINATLSLLKVMADYDVRRLIFSSSATVYGAITSLPLTEESPVGIGLSNPYARTKYFIEQILGDLAQADPSWQFTILRYFNPVGAHQSALIGEDPLGLPNNLMPFVAQVAVGRLNQVAVFGDDYDTKDGTGVRDYIHVVDLARGHVAALDHFTPGVSTYNLGTGCPASVMDLIHAFEAACGKPIAYTITERRPGDIAASYCSPEKARRDLGWSASLTLEDAAADSWRWQSTNPEGYPR